MEKFICGGFVRDILLGTVPKDRDFVVVGSTIEEMIQYGFKQVGKDFPVFLHPHTNEEYALARKDRKSGTGYTGFEFDFNPNITIVEDLFRRDFTIGAMALPVYDDQADKFQFLQDELIDPYNGLRDLKNKIIRHVNDEAFADDPVRVLRACRFAARYNFTIHESTLELMKQCVQKEFDHLSYDRVWKEFEKCLCENCDFNIFVYYLDLVGGLSKLKPFSICLLHQYHTNTSPKIKFAIHTSKFNDIDFEKWKIPKEYSKISKVYQLFLSNIVLFQSYNANKQLEFIKKCDVLQNPVKLSLVLELFRLLDKDFYEKFKSTVNVLKSISNSEIIGSETNGLKIKELIYNKQISMIDCLWYKRTWFIK